MCCIDQRSEVCILRRVSRIATIGLTKEFRAMGTTEDRFVLLRIFAALIQARRNFGYCVETIARLPG